MDINAIKAAVTAQANRVQAVVIDCVHRGTLESSVEAIKDFIETDFLSTNDIADQYPDDQEVADIRSDACNDLVEKFRLMIEDPLEHSGMVDAAHSIM